MQEKAAPEVRRDIHQAVLMAAANRLGVRAEDLAALLGRDVVRYHHRGQSSSVHRGRVFAHLSAPAQELCDDKDACKRLLASVGAPVPRGVRYSDPADPAAVALVGSGGVWVSKPVIGTHSEGVVLGITSPAQLRAAFAQSPSPDCLLEEQIPGADLRIQAIGGRLVAACRREPASVLGDGETPLAGLIAARRAAVQAANPQNDLRIDDEVQAHIAAAGLDLDAVLPAGQRLPLRRTTSMANGGRAVDLTDTIHPDWIELTAAVAAALGMRVLAIDAITEDPARSPADCGAVLEVNARPEWLHHTFSEGRRHDIPRLLLEDLFGRLSQ